MDNLTTLLIALTGWLAALALAVVFFLKRRACADGAESPTDEQDASNLLPDHDTPEEVLRRCLECTTAENDIDTVMNNILEIIGTALQADRCYVFIYRNKAKTISDNTCEWVAPGVIPFKDQLQSIPTPYAWAEHLEKNGMMKVDDIRKPPKDFTEEIITVLTLQGIRSIAVIGLYHNRNLIGFLGVDYVHRQQNITVQIESVVKGASEIYGIAIQRKSYRDAALDNIHLQKQFFEIINIPIILFSPDYRVLAINSAALEAFQTTREEAVGRPCNEVICGAESTPETCPLSEILKTGSTCNFNLTIRGREYQNQMQPVYDRNGKLIYLIECAHDITQIKENERKLEAAVEAALAADRAKSTFLATMSHELRTPLNAVIGFSELLQDNAVPEEEKAASLAAIHTSGQALLTLINDVLDLSRLDSGPLKLTPEPVNVRQLCEELLPVFRIRSDANDTRLILDVPEGFPGILVLDKLRIRQILFNLIGNAVKFTRHGTITLRLNYDPPTETLALVVADTGEGIAPDFLKQLFSPFTQDTHTRGNRAFEGSGLGLAITRRLVDNMKGVIDVESQLGKGTAFTVTLPQIQIGTLPGEQEKAQSHAIDFEHPQDLPPLHMLLVDDVAMNLRVLEKMLSRFGVTCISCESGEAALDYLKSGKPCDAVLADLWMPNMSGQELRDHIKRLPLPVIPPVYAVTADTNIHDSEFAGILYKPLTLEKLGEFLQTFRR